MSSVLAAANAVGLAGLRFGVSGGRTRLIRSETRPPLQVGRALYLDEELPDMAFVCLANPTAGIAAGDCLLTALEVGPGARAHVTTQAASKVLSMPAGEAQQEVRITVHDGGYLEYLPDPVMLYRDADLSQTGTFAVAPGGTLVAGEILVAGRLAMGERFAFRRYATRLAVTDTSGAPLYLEAYALDPLRQQLGLGLLGRSRFPVAGTLLVVTAPAAATELVACLRESCVAATPTGSGVAGVTTFGAGRGVALKALGPDVKAVSDMLEAGWRAARRTLLGVPLPPQWKR